VDLFKASNQWAHRPDDERFWDLDEMFGVCDAYRVASYEESARYRDLELVADSDEVRLVSRDGYFARFTNYAFGQISARAKAPAEYLRRLPAPLATDNLQYGLTALRDDNERARVLIFDEDNDDHLVRGFTSDAYVRVWNSQIVNELRFLRDDGWRTPPARPNGLGGRTRIATEHDVLREGRMGLSVKVGDTIGPAGLYASDRDMFVFMVNEDSFIETPTGGHLARGFFVWNSEVGDRSFGVMVFLYDHVCGNHIVWGAEEVYELCVRHVGSGARDRILGGVEVQLREYADSSTSDIEASIERAMSFQIADNPADLVSKVLGFARKKKMTTLTDSSIAEAYLIAEQTPRYGNPLSAWAISQGLTEVSQRAKWASQRTKMDIEAGKILDMND
jgi:hypothetical protein